MQLGPGLTGVIVTRLDWTVDSEQGFDRPL